MQMPLRKTSPWGFCLFHVLYSTQAAGLLLPVFYTRATALGSAERRGEGASRAQFIHPLYNTCFPGSSRPGSACLSSLHQLICRCPYCRQPQILLVMSASSGPEHSNKCLDTYSFAQMLSTERALCAAGLGKAAASPHALFCRCTTLLMCQMLLSSAFSSRCLFCHLADFHPPFCLLLAAR